MIRRDFSIGAAGLLVPSAFGRAAAQTTAKLRVAAVPIDVGAGPYYAADEGFYVQHGLDVEITTGANGPAIAAAVAGGSLEIGSGNTVVLATGHEHGVNFVLIGPSGAYSSKDPTAGLLVPKSSPAKSAQDLVGKTLGIANIRSISEIAMRAWFNHNGVESQALQFVEVPFNEMGVALDAGRIDAAFAEEPALSTILARGTTKVFGRPYDAIAPTWVEGGYFCTLDYARAQPDIIRRFADAIAETARWANAHHDITAQILEKYGKRTIPPTMHRIYYPERLQTAQIQPLIDAAAKYGVLRASFPAREMFAPGLGV
jgi:NitT/TauT family transport system substrate-binding protein